MKHSVTIRFGAAHWDLTLADGTHFDFRTMNADQRKLVYGTFMGSVRKALAPNKKGKRK